MESTDPRHGTHTGYLAGCKASQGIQCPATPTCNQAHAAMARDYDRRPNIAVGEAQTGHVLRRLNETIAHAGRKATCKRAGISPRKLDQYLAWESRTMPNAEAEALDQAWSFLVHGSDTRAPDFPHGTNRGYTSGHGDGVGHCRCVECRGYARLAAKRLKAKIKSPRNVVTSNRLRARVKTHVETLLEHATIQQIARAAGMTRTPVEKVLRDGPYSHASAKRLLDTTIADLPDAALDRTPILADDTIHRVRTMWALGYSLTWQAQQIGTANQSFHVLRLGQTVTTAKANAVRDLAERIGDTPATPEATGLTQWSINRSRGDARRAGWYPPSAYDDDGTLNVRAIPDHPHAVLDVTSEHKMELLHLLAQGDTQKEATRKVGCSPELVGRLRHGLTYVQIGGTGGGRDLDHLACRDRIVAIRSVYDQMIRGEIGAVTATIMLGVADKRRTTHASVNSPEGLHPEVAAWRERTTADHADAA